MYVCVYAYLQVCACVYVFVCSHIKALRGYTLWICGWLLKILLRPLINAFLSFWDVGGRRALVGLQH